MAEISQIEVNGTTYDICDATARDSLSKCPFPVDSLYLTFNNSNPSTIWAGTTWTQLAAGTFLAASGTGYALESTGGAASVTLTAAQSGVPAHAHGLNGHTHSVGAHSHGLNNHTHTLSGHTHTGTTSSSGDHSHKVINVALQDGSGSAGPVWANKNNNASQPWTTDTVGSHTHSMTTGGPSNNTSGKASGNTANSTVFNTGGNSGNTANNTAANASAAHENRPPYIAIAMWKRTK